MFVFDEQLCTGCRICEQICCLAHYQGTTQDHARLKITSEWPTTEKVAICHQCSYPHCVEACPTGAIQKNNGIIQLEAELCTQCLMCFDACPFGAKVTDQKGYPSFCDTCTGQFQCVRLCPAKALRSGDRK
jgi:Fe-S-cluster-containing hydrogenase component 2